MLLCYSDFAPNQDKVYLYAYTEDATQVRTQHVSHTLVEQLTLARVLCVQMSTVHCLECIAWFNASHILLRYLTDHTFCVSYPYMISNASNALAAFSDWSLYTQCISELGFPLI